MNKFIKFSQENYWFWLPTAWIVYIILFFQIIFSSTIHAFVQAKRMWDIQKQFLKIPNKKNHDSFSLRYKPVNNK